jgi:hypothetical protein
MTGIHPFDTLLRLALALLLAALPAHAQTFDRPNAGQGPTVLQVQIFALDIDEIDSAAQSFTANLFVSVRWQDDRLKHAGPGNPILGADEAWNPSSSRWSSTTNEFRALD